MTPTPRRNHWMPLPDSLPDHSDFRPDGAKPKPAETSKAKGKGRKKARHAKPAQAETEQVGGWHLEALAV